jgi:ATP-dependent DNA helicase PIF1
MTSLNDRQREYVLHVLHSIKSSRPIFEYLSGGAGVGKSTAVTAIVQALTRHFMAQPGARLDEITVLLCAPTGIAAFNIGGATLHSTFILPYNQSNSYGKENNNKLRPLSENIRTEMASKLLGVQLIICDELSMVSNKQLSFINERLQQIFRNTELFGGKSVIFVGDLWQLPPIASGYIFSPLQRDISSLAATSIWDNFRFYELDEIMRQAEDPAFAVALSHMNTGVMTDEDIILLKSREISK